MSKTKSKVIHYILHHVYFLQILNSSDSQHKESNAPSVNSRLVDEESIRPGHWLEMVHRVPFNALTLMAARQEEQPACKNHAINLHRFSSETSVRRGPERELTDPKSGGKKGRKMEVKNSMAALKWMMHTKCIPVGQRKGSSCVKSQIN